LDHIVFHNDVDGMVSAALFQGNSSENFNYQNSCIHPVNSTMRGETLDRILSKIPPEEKVAILDFQFSKRADIWIDHHYDNALGSDPIKNDHMIYDPMAKSSAHIIGEQYGIDACELIQTVDMIDSASYPDPKFIFESDHPLMILRAYLETVFPSDMMYSRIVEVLSLCSCDVGKAIKKLGIDYQSVKNIKNIALKISKDVLKFGVCSVVNQTRQCQFPRYSEYFILKDVEYAIRISISGPHQKYVQIGHNRWCGKQSKINVGEFLRNLSYCRGGGHFSVGAGIIKNEYEEKFLDDVDLNFNREDGMEKYGVDKEDTVEKRAQELVKTGVDIHEARKQSQKEMEERKNVGSEGKL